MRGYESGENLDWISDRYTMTYRQFFLVVVPPMFVTALVPVLWYMTAASTIVNVVAAIYVLALMLWAAPALLRKDWGAAAVRWLAVLLCILLRFGGPTYSLLEEAGFWAMTFPTSQYIRQCHPTIFFEDGLQQEVGLCDIMHRFWVDYFDYIVYDTSGEIDRPPGLRTDQWKDVVRLFPLGRVIATIQLRTTQIIGPFYAVRFDLQDADRSAALPAVDVSEVQLTTPWRQTKP